MLPDAAMALAIRHLPGERRFAADIHGATAYATYREREDRILDLDHTFVPVALRERERVPAVTAWCRVARSSRPISAVTPSTATSSPEVRSFCSNEFGCCGRASA